MDIAARIIKGEFGLAKTFWLFWFVPSIFINYLLGTEEYILFLISLNQTNYYLAATVALATGVIYISCNIAMMVANWNAASGYSGLKVWPVLTKLYILIIALVIGYSLFDSFTNKPLDDAGANKSFPFEGYWQTKCGDNSGIVIMHVTGAEFSVQFCSGAGCSDPGKYKPNTSIINDTDYKIIDEKHMYIKDHFGNRKYTLCQTPHNP
jgi:hypothetical protein